MAQLCFVLFQILASIFVQNNIWIQKGKKNRGLQKDPMVIPPEVDDENDEKETVLREKSSQVKAGRRKWREAAFSLFSRRLRQDLRTPRAKHEHLYSGVLCQAHSPTTIC